MFGNRDEEVLLSMFVGFQTDAAGAASDIDTLLTEQATTIENSREIDIGGRRGAAFNRGDIHVVLIAADGQTLEVNALGSPVDATPTSDELVQIASAVLS